SVTQFFRAKTSAPLAVKFLPIVKQVTQRVGLAQKYNQFAGQGAKLGLIKGDAANIEQYVTDKALDGLFLMIGEEEHAIRKKSGCSGQRDCFKSVWRVALIGNCETVALVHVRG